MKINSIETFATQNVCFVRIRTDEGHEGIGQTAWCNADITAQVLHRQIAPHVLGADPENIDAIVDRCIEANHKFPWSYVCRATAGIDTALWDIKGKHVGKSVCVLLGGTKKNVPVYGSSMSRNITPQDEADRLKRLMDSHGYRAFKIRLGKTVGHNQDMWPGRTEKIIPAVRKAVGDSVAMHADANSCYTPERAIEVGRMLEDNGYMHYEEPCPYWELEWTADVASALDIPVAGGEQDVDLAQWSRMIKMNAVDIVQPDVCYVGGLTRALRVAKMAEEAGKLCTPHVAQRSLLTIFSLHMLGAIPNAGPYMEFSIEDVAWVKNLFEPEPEARHGEVPIPQKPGWGVTLNQEWLEKADYAESKLDG
jgi:L-alanine-DL-glutamate epimerase-like enolase superfamily enzyme